MKVHHFLFLAAMFITACTSAPTSQTEEVNDSNTPLHLLKPEYKVPYGELSADDVKGALDRVFAYCEQGTFRLGSYEWGITYQALMAATKATGDKRYEGYVKEKFDLIKESVAAAQKGDTASIKMEPAVARCAPP